MIRQILVALDPDSDTPVASHYAAEIAKCCSGEVSGVAVVDMGSIEKEARGGGIGSLYLMEKMENRLTDEAREVARKLLRDFRSTMSDAGVACESHIEEGVPVARLVEDMNFCDLLVMGRDPHFYYSHPEETSVSLGRVLKQVVGPVLVVPSSYRAIRRVLVAFDGSPACVRSLRSFLYGRPFGANVALDIVNVHPKGHRAASQLLLRNAQSYVRKHGISADVSSIAGVHPTEEIIRAIERAEADLLVAGAHFITPVAKLTRGSTTSSLVRDVQIPMWLES